MTTRVIVLISMSALVLLLTSCQSGPRHRTYWKIFYEMRAPKTAELDGHAHFEFVTDQGSTGSPLDFAGKREEDGFIVYYATCLLAPSERRRAVMYRPIRSPAQVFVLAIPRPPKPVDWSDWQRPVYVEQSIDASWTFMHDLKQQQRSTNLPRDCLEVRYRITRLENL